MILSQSGYSRFSRIMLPTENQRMVGMVSNYKYRRRYRMTWKALLLLFVTLAQPAMIVRKDFFSFVALNWVVGRVLR